MRLSALFGVVASVFVVPALAEPPGQPAKPPAKPAAAPLDLDDPVEPLVPLHPRTEAEADRVRAHSLFSAGRAAEQKQDFAAALRLYQRALRYDSNSVPVLREIVPLAFSQDRPAEAVRYALMYVEKEPIDSVLLKRLAVTLSDTGDDERALKLYEKAAELDAKQKPSATQVLLWMEMGRLYFLAKNYPRAADSFAQVIQALDNPEQYGLDDAVRRKLLGAGDITYQLFGESFLEAGRTDEALAAFEKANVLLPNEGVLAYQRARIDAKRKQPAAALEKLQVYFKKHLSNQGAGPYELLATLLQETNQADQLVPRLEALAADDPDNAQVTYFLAQQYVKTNQLAKAEPLLLKLLDVPNKRPPVEAYQGLVDVYRRTDQTGPLLALLGDAISRGGSLAVLGEQAKALETDAGMSAALIELGRRQKAANDPNFDYGRSLAVAMLALSQKQWDAAGEFFDLAIKDEPKKAPEILLTRGMGLLVANQASDAVKVFQRGVDEKLLPADNPTFQFYLSGALELSGQTDAAIKYAQEAADIRKESPRFLSRVAWIQYHAKRYADARASYKALLEKFDGTFEPDEVREVMHDARMALSNIDVIEHHMPDAEEWLEQVLDEFPEDVGALNDLGYLWADQGKHLERSLVMIRKAIDSDPKNMAYLDSLGWALFRLGRYPEAVTQLQAAAAVEKPDAVIFDHLGDALQKSGDPPAAKAAWQRALEGFEKDADAEKAKAVREKLEKQ
jgi:tetratricopeptide (TPR) repeat protein